MKKISLCFLYFLITNTNAFSQSFHFGGAAILSYSTLHIDSKKHKPYDNPNFQSGKDVTSYGLGGMVDYDIGICMVGSGIYFVQRSAGITITDVADTLTVSTSSLYRLNYLDIPILLKSSMNNGATFLELYWEVGFNTSFLLSANGDIKKSINSYSSVQDNVDVKNEIKPILFALATSLGLSKSLGRKTDKCIIASIWWNYGLNNVMNNQDGITLWSGGLKVGFRL